MKELYNAVPLEMYGPDYFCLFRSLRANQKELHQIFNNKNAVEIGCGAGHLSEFLSKYFKTVTSFDLSPKSVKLAKKLAKQRNINNVQFFEADLFKKKFNTKFDYVLCSGVLHHTGQPYEGFQKICTLLKDNGIITVGVYSRTQIRYRITRNLVILLAKNDLKKREKIGKIIFWLFYWRKPTKLVVSDGYVNPVVSFHSISEVFSWLNNNDIDYIGSWPPIEITHYPRLAAELIIKLFNKNKKIYSWSLKERNKTNITSQKRNTIISLINYNPISFWIVELMWALSGISVMLNMSGIKRKNK